ncbi:MAG: hypothetical protein AAF236_15825 [Verrucomicrobiota bacterium]
MSEQLVYSLSTGRCGTVYLTHLIQQNIAPDRGRVYHERVGFPHFGINTPDASHLTTFNQVGNAPNVARFFQRKFERDLGTPQPTHVELSHFLGKAGLVENLAYLDGRARVDLIALRRDPYKIAWSFINRFDFINNGFTWLFSLDPAYRNVIVPSAPFREAGMFGSAVWYVAEMFARISYYRSLVESELPWIHWHETRLEEIIEPAGSIDLLNALGFETEPESLIIPEKQNETKQEFFGEKEAAFTRKLMDRLFGDPDALGRAFFESGRRLAKHPQIVATPKTSTAAMVPAT